MRTKQDEHAASRRLSLAAAPALALLILSAAGGPQSPDRPDAASGDRFAEASGTVTPSPPDYVRLDARLSELRTAFNESPDRVRLVLGLSPTCGACLRRARATQQRLLERFESDELVAHVVWIPTHGAREKHVNRVLDLIPDGRATHYWDTEGAFMRLFDEPLSSGDGDAEGVVMLYDRDVRWNGRIPPVPLAWVYQPRHIDRLERRLASLLDE